MLSSLEGTYIKMQFLYTFRSWSELHVLQNGELYNELRPVKSSTSDTLSTSVRNCCRTKGLTFNSYFLGHFRLEASF